MFDLFAQIFARTLAESVDQIVEEPRVNPNCSTIQMVMALAPLSLCYPMVSFEDDSVVSKSYPTFWEEVNKKCSFY